VVQQSYSGLRPHACVIALNDILQAVHLIPVYKGHRHSIDRTLHFSETLNNRDFRRFYVNHYIDHVMLRWALGLYLSNLTKMWLAKVTSGKSLSGSLSTPGHLRDVADLKKSVATARESVLDVSSLKAKSGKRGREASGLLGRHKGGSQ
jgi:hypothetical protein